MSGQRDLPTFLFDYETNRQIHDALPDFFLDFLSIATRLGDGATVVALAMLFFWFGKETDWRKRGMLMAIAVATLSLNAGLKGILEVSRPLFAAQAAGDPLAFAPETYEGLSTPSAHAMGAAAIYGGLAVVMDVGKRWQRWLVAGIIIFLVALSRVTQGLHYPGDVLLGIVLGFVLIWFALWLVTEDTRTVQWMFLFSLVVALVSNPLGSEEFVTMSIGASAGGLVAWLLIHDQDPQPLGGSIVLFGILVIPALVAFRTFEALVTIDILIEIAGMELPVMPGIRATGYAIIFGIALAVPVIAERFNDHPHARWLQKTLPFRGRTVDADQVEQSIEQLGD